jgi:hypothetical protein
MSVAAAILAGIGVVIVRQSPEYLGASLDFGIFRAGTVFLSAC